jgi:Haloacid dehalogenase-like hydrolase/Phosphoribosyl transferase domain
MSRVCDRSSELIRPHPTVKVVVFDLEGVLMSPGGRPDRDFPVTTPVPGTGELLELLQAQVPLGVLTRMSRTDSEVVLHALFPRLRWAAVVSGTDLECPVPHPDGLELLADQLQLTDNAQLIYICDGVDDIEAAYHAGTTVGLATWTHTDRQASRLLPDAVLPDLEALLEFLTAPARFFPPLESSQSSRHTGIPEKMTFRSVALTRPDGGTLSVNVLGRYFARKRAVRHLHDCHRFSQGIARKDEEGAFTVPRAWLPVLRALIGHMAKRHQVDAVTVIPARRGRDPRLERLLERIRDGLGGAWSGEYLPTLLRFRPDARRVRFAGFAERYRRAAAGLEVVGNVKGKRVMVLDDVLTTGATLAGARDKLLAAGATEVISFALTATISDHLLTVFPHAQRCSRCGGRLHQMVDTVTRRPVMRCGRRSNGCPDRPA